MIGRGHRDGQLVEVIGVAPRRRAAGAAWRDRRRGGAARRRGCGARSTARATSSTRSASRSTCPGSPSKRCSSSRSKPAATRASSSAAPAAVRSRASSAHRRASSACTRGLLRHRTLALDGRAIDLGERRDEHRIRGRHRIGVLLPPHRRARASTSRLISPVVGRFARLVVADRVAELARDRRQAGPRPSARSPHRARSRARRDARPWPHARRSRRRPRRRAWASAPASGLQLGIAQLEVRLADLDARLRVADRLRSRDRLAADLARVVEPRGSRRRRARPRAPRPPWCSDRRRARARRAPQADRATLARWSPRSR